MHPGQMRPRSFEQPISFPEHVGGWDGSALTLLVLPIPALGLDNPRIINIAQRFAAELTQETVGKERTLLRRQTQGILLHFLKSCCHIVPSIETYKRCS